MSDDLTPWLERWGLTFERTPASPGGREPYPGTGAVAFVRRGDQPLVLKVLPEGADEARSGAVLTHWNGEGAVRLIEQAPGAVLIERAIPGDDLSDLSRAGRDDEATEALCEVMAKLNRPPPVRGGYRRVEDWGQGFVRLRGNGLSAGLDGALIDLAGATFHDLRASQGSAILLHGDLQHYNVVRDAARGWLAIDPKGVLGEAAYETGAMLRNPIANPEIFTDPAVMARRVAIICERLGHDRERVLGWCFSQWMLAILWAIGDGLRFETGWLAGPLATLAVMDS
ncbi:MAG TPA: aminoglycoside phosphotransferase family protein [Caulobacteraceae bacterium]